MAIAELIGIGGYGDLYEIYLGANRYHYRTDGRAWLMKEGMNHSFRCRVTSETIKYALAAIADLQCQLNQQVKGDA